MLKIKLKVKTDSGFQEGQFEIQAIPRVNEHLLFKGQVLVVEHVISDTNLCYVLAKYNVDSLDQFLNVEGYL